MHVPWDMAHVISIKYLFSALRFQSLGPSNGTVELGGVDEPTGGDTKSDNVRRKRGRLGRSTDRTAAGRRKLAQKMRLLSFRERNSSTYD